MQKNYIIIVLIFLALLILTLLLYKSQDLKKAYQSKVEEGLSHGIEFETTLVSENDVNHLPLPVQRYLNYVGVIGKEKVYNFRITFTGQMKIDPKKDWLKINTEQYNFMDDLTRMFYIKAKMYRIPILGLDSYKQSKGNMLIKLGGVFTVADASGPEMDIGEQVTLLNDLCLWAPATLIDPRIQWESIDSLTAKAIFNDNGRKVSAILYFNPNGALTNFVTEDRYMTIGKTYQKAQWSTPVKDYKEVNGSKLPTYGEGIWHLPEGDYCYAKFNLEKVDYNVKAIIP